MQKTKWISVSSDSNLDDIVSFFHATPYSEAIGYGFDLVEQHESSATVKYSEKNAVTEAVMLPNGKQESVKFDRYINFYFILIKVSSGRFLIKVNEPPRALKNFLRRVADAGPKKLYFEEVKLDIDAFMTNLQKDYSLTRLLVKKAVIDKVAISDYSQARLEISSSGNAYRDFVEKFGGRSHVLQKVIATFTVADFSTKLEISRTGLLLIDETILGIDPTMLVKLILSSIVKKD